jgi:hypothetical protein
MRTRPLAHPRRTIAVAISTVMVAGTLTLGLAPSASAATSPPNPASKLTVATGWTQPTPASYAAWAAARAHQPAWSRYRFDWSTDYCTASPDEPLGFDFRLPCARHDFGHRNLTALGVWSTSESRVDAAFHDDLLAVCAHYGTFRRPVCATLATTYYDAVRIAGAITNPARTR